MKIPFNLSIFKNLYLNSLIQYVFSRKTTYILPAIMIVWSFIFSLISFSFATQDNFLIFSFVFFLINLLFTVVFGSCKFLNVFYDLYRDGLDTILFTKPYSRKHINATKILFCILLAITWSLIFMGCNWIFYVFNIVNIEQIKAWSGWDFFSPLFAFLIFGSISGLLASRFNFKLSITTPIALFTPLLFLGTATSVFATPSNLNYAHYLNLPDSKTDSQTILDLEKFYLNNNEDTFYLIPKNVSNTKISQKQANFLSDAWNKSSSSSQLWQAISYLSLPYQFINVFNYSNQGLLRQKPNKETSDLGSYIYYHGLESAENSYEVNHFVSLPTYNLTLDNPTKKYYLVPGSLKNNTVFDNQQNKDIIYANKNASNFNFPFKEDDQIFGVPNNLVGKIKWEYLKQILESKTFLIQAKLFYSSLNTHLSKQQYLEKISSFIKQNEENQFKNLTDNNTIVLNSFLDTSKIKSNLEKNIYIATALIYYLFFNNNQSPIFNTLLKNEDGSYKPEKFSISIDNQDYFIGGYASYVAEQREINNKTIYRYHLSDSNNFLFQPVEEVYQVTVKTHVVKKNTFVLEWILISAIMLFSLYSLHNKKDYR
ncbi:ABC transporter permease [Mesomycoplasma hyorhinis]|uniref:ABC transporter permease n=1 Tax=Mesomycoplasma hyorhinis TaxID=2100 RepID=UPI003DA4E911